MKQLSNYVLTGLLLALSFGLSAQAGNTITLEENSGEFGVRTLELAFEGEENGRNRYGFRTGGDVFTHAVVRWDGTRWEITDGNDSNGSNPADATVIYVSNYDVGPNPPNAANGNWIPQFAGDLLLRLEGDGTQSVDLGFTLAAGPFATDAGVQTGLGGGTPVGGVYSGTGVTDDGNGMTFSFDPAAAGVGQTTVLYGDGPGGMNNVTQTIEVAEAGDQITMTVFNQTDNLSFAGQVNGRNSYFVENFGISNSDVTVSWSGERWEIFIVPDQVIISSGYDVGPNPPDFATGNWNSSGLTRLDGDGTQAVDLAFTLAAGPFTTEDGVQAGLGGGTPVGGVYSGTGVTDDGNGVTFSFDPAVAGVGTTTISYGDGPNGANNVTQTVEVIDLTEVCVLEAFAGTVPSALAIVNGQNFTACTTGRVTSIDVDVQTASTTVTLKLNKGIDTEGEDYSQEVSFTETGRVRIELTEPFIVVEDSVYAFSLTDDTGLFDSRGSFGNPFTGGSFFNEDGQVPDVDLNFALIIDIDSSAVSTRPDLDNSVVSLSAYPNPTNGNFNVTYNLTESSQVTVVLYDAQGRKLRTIEQGNQVRGPQQVTVNREGIPAGMVYYGLITERGHSAVKSLIVR